MKYSEAEKKIKDILEDMHGSRWEKFYRLEDEELAFGLAGRNHTSKPFKNILMVSKHRKGWLEVEDLDRTETDLADIFMELSLTPPEERKEERKYVIKVWDQENPDIIVKNRLNGIVTISIASVAEEFNKRADEPVYQVAFTQTEIDRLKNIISLNINWDKAVEVYDGQF